MLANGLLLVAVLIASITDVRNRKIYNWTTYPGILVALVINAWASWQGLPPEGLHGVAWHGAGLQGGGWLGAIGLEESGKGLALCGGLMLTCFVLFGIGGGDVKLLAMVGAFLGIEQGLEVLLWTFVLAGILGAAILIWRVGSVRLFLRCVGWLWSWLRWTTQPDLTLAERALFRSDLFLAPCTFVAVVLVKSGWLPNL